MTEFSEIQKLVELFSLKNGNSDSDDDADENCTSGNINPSDVDQSNKPKKVNPYSKIEPEGTKRKEILDPDDDNDFIFNEEKPSQTEWKATPEWDISYRQQVTASDIYLQMGFKNPATASCEDMIVTIHLPGESLQNMDLKILADKLTLLSPRYYLEVTLPHPVDPKRGKATFDNDQEKLIVTLKMDRELDLVNF